MFDDCLRPRTRVIPLINAVKLNFMNGADQARCLNDSLRPATQFIPLINAVKINAMNVAHLARCLWVETRETAFAADKNDQTI